MVKVLWAYICTPQCTTQETPFWLTYGANAMLPVKVGQVSLQRHYFVEAEKNEALQVDLDLIDQVREDVVIITETYK